MVAPDNAIQRPLRFWEQVCSFMGVSMGFELDGKITPEMIKQAYALLQKEYPYLRCVLTQDNNLLSFVEKTPTPVRWSIVDASLYPAMCFALIIDDALHACETVASRDDR